MNEVHLQLDWIEKPARKCDISASSLTSQYEWASRQDCSKLDCPNMVNTLPG